MGELLYLDSITTMFENSPSFKSLTCRCIYSGESNFEFENLGEFSTEFVNILEYE